MSDIKPTVRLIRPMGAIREFFNTPENPVTLDEMKRLTQNDRKELAPACAAALGVELDTTT